MEGKIRGVIHKVSVDITEQEILNNLRGGNILSVNQMGNPKNGRDSTPVEELLRYMAYHLPYERAPLQCFKCQRYGHVAAVCRGHRYCRRCGEDHD